MSGEDAAAFETLPDNEGISRTCLLEKYWDPLFLFAGSPVLAHYDSDSAWRSNHRAGKLC